MKRALLVDDEVIVREFVGELLSDAGYTVVEACDGQHAVRRLGEGFVFQQIVSDKDMPRMSGVEFLMHVRADSRTAHIPFILMSGTDTVSKTDRTPLEEVCVQFSAHFLGKPFSLEAFLNLLD